MPTQTEWEERYRNDNTGWDIGHISTPLKEYFDQLEDKTLKILIPGGGNGYEAAYLFEQGFHNVYLLDFAPSPLKNFSEKNPDFPQEQLIQSDFFEHSAKYDLIVEQTFFCAIPPEQRKAYAEKVYNLLRSEGKLVGLLWAQEMNTDQPPYGGDQKEYHSYFDEYFNYLHFEKTYNSIPPRASKELFLLAQKKT